jgi:hypothetical protein
MASVGTATYCVFFLRALAAVVMLGLVACSTVPTYGNTPQSLSVRLLANGSKQFTYRLGRVVKRSRRRLEQAPRQLPDRRDYERLQRRAAYVVAATGYCRRGYMELDFRLNMRQQWLRGECKESATEADIDTFGGRKNVSLEALEE